MPIISEDNLENAKDAARFAITQKLHGEGKKRTPMEINILLAKVETYLFDGLVAAGIPTDFSLTHNSKEETSSEDRSTEDGDRSVTNEVEKKSTSPSIYETVAKLERQKKELLPGTKRDDITLQRAGIYAALDSLFLTHLLQPPQDKEKKNAKAPKNATSASNKAQSSASVQQAPGTAVKAARLKPLPQGTRHRIIRVAHAMTLTRFHSLEPEQKGLLTLMVESIEKWQISCSLPTSLQNAQENCKFATSRPHVADYFFSTVTTLMLEALQPSSSPQPAGASR